MKNKSKDEIVKRYQRRISEHGETFLSLGSGSKEHQNIRFNILKDKIKNNYSILDVGCGLGDFYNYLIQNDIHVDYYGVDLVPEFINQAKKTYPGVKFEVRDILENSFDNDSFDVVVCSQVLNYNLSDESNIDNAKLMIKQMHAISRVHLVCDFVTDYVDYKDDHLFYYKPEEIFSFCKTLSKRVDLIHSYPLFEFCVFLYTDFRGWNNQ